MALAKADMIAETAPILSVNLRSKAGRIPKKARNDHHHHASLNIVAHKRSEYVCNSKFVDRTRRSFVAEVGARLSDLDDIGVVVSATHPPKSTFLAPAVVDYCVARSVCRTCCLPKFVEVQKCASAFQSLGVAVILLDFATLCTACYIGVAPNVYAAPRVRRSWSPPNIQLPELLSGLLANSNVKYTLVNAI